MDGYCHIGLMFSTVSDLSIHPESSVKLSTGEILRKLVPWLLDAFADYVSFSTILPLWASSSCKTAISLCNASRFSFSSRLCSSFCSFRAFTFKWWIRLAFEVFQITEVLLLLVSTSCECLPSSSICKDPGSLLWPWNSSDFSEENQSLFIRLLRADCCSVVHLDCLVRQLTLFFGYWCYILTQISTADMLSPMTQRSSRSLVLLDQVSDSFSLGVFSIQFCFVWSTRLCLNFLEWGHLIAASADILFAIWLRFHSFVPTFGLFNICLTSGNQYP